LDDIFCKNLDTYLHIIVPGFYKNRANGIRGYTGKTRLCGLVEVPGFYKNRANGICGYTGKTRLCGLVEVPGFYKNRANGICGYTGKTRLRGLVEEHISPRRWTLLV